MVEDAGDYEVDEGVDAGGTVVEARGSGENDDADATEGEEIVEVNCTERGLARDEEEGAAFFEGDVRGAFDEGAGGAVSNGADGTHGAGTDDHASGTRRA
jgi:hypothetical protein